LEQLRDALLHVHRTLLHAERGRYERVHGEIPGNTAFLQLAIHHEWFAWLQPVTATVVRIDARTMSRRDPLQAREVPGLLAEAAALLRPDPEGTAYQRQYHEVLREVPSAAAEVRAVVSALGRDPASSA
jgi:hypothetical protein